MKLLNFVEFILIYVLKIEKFIKVINNFEHVSNSKILIMSIC